MLMILAVFSIFFGFITKDMFIGLGSGFFSDNALFIHPSHEIMLDTEFGVPTLFKLLPLIFTISLSVIAIVLSEYLSTILIYFKLSRVGYNLFSFFNQRFLIELFYNRYITGIILKLGGQTTKVIDKGSVEYLGPWGLEKGLLNISSNIARLNTGVITSYALYILIGLIAYLLFNSYINSCNIILALCVSLSLVLSSSNSYAYTGLISGLSEFRDTKEYRVRWVDIHNKSIERKASHQEVEWCWNLVAAGLLGLYPEKKLNIKDWKKILEFDYPKCILAMKSFNSKNHTLINIHVIENIDFFFPNKSAKRQFILDFWPSLNADIDHNYCFEYTNLTIVNNKILGLHLVPPVVRRVIY